MRENAKEAVASESDLVLAQTNFALEAIRDATRNLPIVFLQVSDPVGGGFVENLARPGGNELFMGRNTIIGSQESLAGR